MPIAFDFSQLDFSKSDDGLIPAVVQNHRSGKILMVAFVNREAIGESIATGYAHFYSRSRQKLWKKGEESGNVLRIIAIAADCDQDALIYAVEPTGHTCHTGEESCFFSENEIVSELEELAKLDKLIAERQEKMPPDSYVAELFRSGIDRIAQKVGEEGVEVVIAAKNNDTADFLGESADLLFHLLILLRAKQCELSDVLKVLRQRSK